MSKFQNRSVVAVSKNPRHCSICGLVIPTCIADGNHSLHPSIDHIVPLSKKGQNHWTNRAVAHRVCNGTKKDLLALDVCKVYELQKEVARLLNRVGVRTETSHVEGARQRLGIPPSGRTRIKGTPRMLAQWEDDGGAVDGGRATTILI